MVNDTNFINGNETTGVVNTTNTGRNLLPPVPCPELNILKHTNGVQPSESPKGLPSNSFGEIIHDSIPEEVSKLIEPQKDDGEIPFSFKRFEVRDIDEENKVLEEFISDKKSMDDIVVASEQEREVVFIVDNWLENDKHPTLKQVQHKGAALWIYTDGEFAFRRNANAKVNKKMMKSKLKMVLNKMLRQVVEIDDESDKVTAIKSFDLTMVSEDTFNPHILQEFFEKDDEVYRNMFRPTKYMFLKKGTPYKKPIGILKMIEHLTDYKPERTKWVINWLAYFYQNLKRSPVAWVAKGPQGGSKGIFFEKVLSPIFGETQTIQVNDKTMKGNFIGGVVENRLVINLDEISTGMKSNKEFKNQLKAIVSNRFITAEKKFLNTEHATELFALIFITTNEPQALEVEHQDRRFTVYTTAGNIAKVDFLGYYSYDALLKAIEAELMNFAHFLNNYDVDVKLATTAQDTPEKEALVGATTDRFHQFYVALLKKDLDYFEDLKYMHRPLYDGLKFAFAQNLISKKQLRHYFNSLEDENISSKKLMSKLRTIDAFFFDDKNNSKGTEDGDRLYILNSEYNHFYTNAA